MKKTALTDEVYRKRWEIIRAAGSSEYYSRFFMPGGYAPCPLCGKTYAPPAPMIRQKDWERITTALGVEPDGSGLICQACAERGNGGRLALSQIEPVPFSLGYVLTEHAIPVEGTEEELAVIDYFHRYALKRIAYHASREATRREKEDGGTSTP